MSIPQLREVRVTRREPGGKFLNAHREVTESGLSRHGRSNQTFPHREVIREGFVTRVIEGRESAEKCAIPTSAPNRLDLGQPDARDSKGYLITKPEAHQEIVSWKVESRTGARQKVWDGSNGVQTSPRRVRTVADGDEKLAGVKSEEIRRDGAKERKVRQPRVSGGQTRQARVKSDPYADVREFAIAHGIPLEKIADKRVRAAIRELITHREQVAAYAAK